MESHWRSIFKSLSWRVLATMITFSVALFLIGEVDKAASIGVADTVIKFAIYYYHERLWTKIDFGRFSRAGSEHV
ncbi:hypothetical protein STSP2_01047 [Anaerohalosphaera lusitana]|uniref:DUF2061 domain-containing protein n=1 Tax=Anaerohalosphaera lusitana TaxID=1936003 RepID=A0A1U9NJA1_9BACT|nr:DUF2061 domain-containing protein [Anaerohalosphaera lusitana]AQT67895.1 hypothetical protein STSP2_01047 [Anaerohalosphaera lusitana]